MLATDTPRRLSLPFLAILLALNVATLGLAFSAALRTSVTTDEFAHVPLSLALFRERAFHVDSGTAPLPSLLAAVPLVLFAAPVQDPAVPAATDSAWILGKAFVRENAADYHRLCMLARLPSLLALLAACLLTAGFARSLYGTAGGCLAAFCVAFEPNLLAHGQLVNSDVHYTAAVVAVLWAFDALLRNPGWRRALVLGLALGIAVLCKLTGVVLFAFLPLAALAAALGRRRADPTDAWAPLGRLVGLGCLAAAVALAVINLGYGGAGTFTPLGAYTIETPILRQLHAALPGWLPVPVPQPFVHGFERQIGERGYQAYLLGTFNEGGFWNYYLVAMLVKLPVPLLVLAAAATLLGPRLERREIPLLVTGVGTFLLFSLAFHKNIGLRYLLFLVPLLCVWIGRLGAAGARRLGRAGPLAAGACGLWLVTSTVLAWPHYLAYFNVASGGSDRGHEYLLDSNLDWGQDLIALQRWMEAEGVPIVDLAYFGRVPPEVYGVRYRSRFDDRPGAHPTVISANLLWGLRYFVNGTTFWPVGRDAYARFRSVEPTAVLGHSLYVFPPDA